MRRVLLTGWIHDALGAVLPFLADLRFGARGFAVALLAVGAALLIDAAPARSSRRRSPSSSFAAASVPVAVSAVRLADVTRGRDDHLVLEASVSLLGARYDSAAARDAYVRRVYEALLGDPRVEAVARVEGFRERRIAPTAWSDSLFVDGEATPRSPSCSRSRGRSGW